MFTSLNLLLVAVLASPVASFVVAGPQTCSSTFASLASTATEEADLTKPAYDIEPIPIRIGHGFDIHRMAPIEEAGQPVVIGGVTITHKDQKVRLFGAMWRMPFVSESRTLMISFS